MAAKANQKFRLVVVDDDYDFLTVMRHWLIPKYEVVCLPNGMGLLDELADIQPDAVILDVKMPGMDGFQLCRRIREDGRFSTMPVLFLTACQDDEDFVSNLDAGGTAYLAKPITRKQLHSKLQEVLTEQPSLT